MIRLAACLLILLTSCSPTADVTLPDDAIATKDLQSGSAFLTEETRALQEDDFENPGLLWVERGADLFVDTSASSKSCADCHDEQLKGVAASYPQLDELSAELVNLEKRINLCRARHQDLPELTYESDDLLALTAYVANQSHGAPITVAVTEETRASYEAGEAYFYTPRGQFNLACNQCHNENWGKKLRGDTISQGHGNGFPAYRYEWQSFGSLHRRLHDCDTGVRAEPFTLGSQTYIDLEYYLAVRANGLPVESPAIRR
ncbi:MAG: sulfur oxidation c-type cytochrome SoxA [Ponticaulis sp.]|nr:sulfur oxidation c-type cytochrome SoxA [Ponticaulis sp.]